MMDVLHFLYEDDFTAMTEEHMQSRSALRDSIYNDLYYVDYPFKLKKQPGKSAGGNITDVQHVSEFESLDNVKPVDPKKANDPFRSPRTAADEKSKVKFIDASKVKSTDYIAPALGEPLG